ncbi:MAG: hypothetical protein ACUVT3_09445, partial [Ignavibacterium sp.]
TGQLHKGDSGNGLFIQFIDNSSNDVAIPDEPLGGNSSITFGVLIRAQAFGDRQALLDNKRNVITFEINDTHLSILENLLI